MAGGSAQRMNFLFDIPFFSFPAAKTFGTDRFIFFSSRLAVVGRVIFFSLQSALLGPFFLPSFFFFLPTWVSATGDFLVSVHFTAKSQKKIEASKVGSSLLLFRPPQTPVLIKARISFRYLFFLFFLAALVLTYLFGAHNGRFSQNPERHCFLSIHSSTSSMAR